MPAKSAYVSPSASTGTLAGRPMAPGATSAPVPSLRQWRTRRALFQRELAERAGVQLLTVQRGEAGQALRLDTIRRLAAALQVEPTDLMTLPAADEAPHQD